MVVGYRNYGCYRIACDIAVKVKRIDIFVSDFAIIIQFGSGSYIAFSPLENKRGVCDFR